MRWNHSSYASNRLQAEIGWPVARARSSSTLASMSRLHDPASRATPIVLREAIRRRRAVSLELVAEQLRALLDDARRSLAAQLLADGTRPSPTSRPRSASAT